MFNLVSHLFKLSGLSLLRLLHVHVNPFATGRFFVLPNGNNSKGQYMLSLGVCIENLPLNIAKVKNVCIKF